MAGRKPTPTALKLLRGNPGKRPISKAEPKARRGSPKMPAHLSKCARKAWKSIGPELEHMGVLAMPDGMALELLCDAYAEYRDARDTVELEGATYVSSSTHGAMVRVRPQVAIAADAWRRIAAMLREFGMTPSSRTRVATAGEQAEPANPFAELTG